MAPKKVKVIADQKFDVTEEETKLESKSTAAEQSKQLGALTKKGSKDLPPNVKVAPKRAARKVAAKP